MNEMKVNDKKIINNTLAWTLVLIVWNLVEDMKIVLKFSRNLYFAQIVNKVER